MGATIRYSGGAEKIVYFTFKWCEKIFFFTFTVMEYIHRAWVQIFFSPFFEEEFIYFKILPSPPPPPDI